ncbi:MAG: MotA/TolQ/ExbB proton channel family protein, partial [Bacteroidota bacterium]|nr:MotA/TolQ/ExbB proton channel family protein [Bacteroidota bacterium]
MKQLFALFAVALLFAAPVSAQEGDTIFQSGDSMIVMVPDSAMADSAMMDSAAAAAQATLAEEAPAMPEETVEVTGARQQIKLRIIEGGVLFMSFVVLCLIFGLALAIERIIYLNMATTNTKTLMDEVEAALKSG